MDIPWKSYLYGKTHEKTDLPYLLNKIITGVFYEQHGYKSYGVDGNVTRSFIIIFNLLFIIFYFIYFHFSFYLLYIFIFKIL